MLNSHKLDEATDQKRCGKQVCSVLGDDGERNWFLKLESKECICAEETNETTTDDGRYESSQPYSPKEHATDLYRASDVIDGRFEVLKLIGLGGMGAVYKVFDIETKTVLALKLLHKKFCDDVSAIKRFEQEAEAAMRLDHPNLVPVYGHGITEARRAYLLMEYVEGRSLSEVIEEQGSLLEQRAIRILLQICEALSHAHNHNIIHRDIKPSNVILSRTTNDDDFVRVVDFGIAKTVASDDRETKDLTQTGDVFGSPSYMSPEHCLGFKLDQRSDIYSFGCLMYEMLAGKPPFAGGNAIQLVLKHLNEKPENLTKRKSSFTNLALEKITLKCLEKQQENRPQSIFEVSESLRAVQDGKKTASDFLTIITKAKQKRWTLPTVSVLALSAPIVAIWSLNKDNALTDGTCAVFTISFGILGLGCLIFAVLMRVASGKCLVREDTWTICSLIASSICFFGLIPLTVSILFQLGHSFDSIASQHTLPAMEPIIFCGMYLSAICSLIPLLSFLASADKRSRKARREPIRGSVIKTFATMFFCSTFFCTSVLLIPVVGNQYLLTSIVNSTANVPTSFGKTIRIEILDYLASRTPENEAVSWDCLNGYDSIQEYSKEIRACSKSVTKRSLKKYVVSSIQFRMGMIYEKLGHWKLAINSYDESLKTDPDDSSPLLRKAHCLEMLGRPFAALSELGKLHLVDPSNTSAYYLEAKILLSLDKIPAALNCVERKMALSGGRTPTALLYKSILLEKLGLKVEARETLKRVSEIDDDPYDEFYWKALKATIYAKLGDISTSKKQFARISEVDRINALRYQQNDLFWYPDELKNMMIDTLKNDPTVHLLLQ